MATSYNLSWKLSQSAEFTTKLSKQKQFIRPFRSYYKTVLSRWNYNLHEEIQLKLAADPNFIIREELALNKNLFPSAQKILIQNDSYRLRRALVLNKNLIPELFKSLFAEFKDEVIFHFENEEFKYNNINTQELLEQYLLLI